MSEIMRLMPFSSIMDWALCEYKENGSVFGIRKDKFYKNESGKYITMFGDKLASPVGPAAGPNSQLAQNIITSYLGGSRFIELKTVQNMDGEELRKCVARPCINAQDECYNVEWSTELYVPEAFAEYVKAWIATQVLAKEFGISDKRDFAFNMSVGYDLDGIKTEKIDGYIEGMKNASETPVWKECIGWLRENVALFKNVDGAFIDSIEPRVCSSITLSTLHGCPPAEIERIAAYLLTEKKTHTFIKCNPTLLGYETAREILDKMGYGYVSFDDHHFNNDMQYPDAVKMLERLMKLAKSVSLEFGVKITNTFPVQIKNNELPGEEMYMSGRSLFPLSITVANKLTQEFGGRLPISFSGGADFFNIDEILKTGIRPITIATTILKPGGYERIKQIADKLELLMDEAADGVSPEKLAALVESAYNLPRHQKDARIVKSRKTDSDLPIFDCFKAPCKEGGCPIEQQIPEYLTYVAEGRYAEAFDIIAIDNACPSVTGEICSHICQTKCTRLDYDDSIEIRNSKRIAAAEAQTGFTDGIKPAELKTDKKAVVIGAGPGGIATALYLRRNGVSVTVLEKRDKPFGIVEYVIPEFRIPAEAMKRDFDMAVKSGVEFMFGVDSEYDIAALKKDYDYAVIATGAWKEGASPVKEGQDKIYDALEFLQDSKKNGLNVVLGKTVAVVGGGDVAMDCARAAKRAPGVESVTIVYRRTREFMPAEREEIELALEDGVELIELLAPVSYDGKMLKCETMKLGERDESGRRGVVGTGEFKELSFDTVIGAVGARVCTRLIEKNGIKLGARGKVEVDENCQTSMENVFVAGDCKAGPSTIVAAMADGKKIARAILADLGLKDDFKRVSVDHPQAEVYAKKGILEAASKDNTDGRRCLNCAEICEICAGVCPNRANVAIDVSGFENRHQILHVDGMCNECGNCGIFCPHNGNPYKDKITLFWTEEDFADSTNKGFLKLGENRFKVRLMSGEIVEHELGDGKVPEGFEAVIEKTLKDYSYLYAI